MTVELCARLWRVASLVVLALVVIGCSNSTPPHSNSTPPPPAVDYGRPAQTKLEARQAMRRGMTEAEVRRLLGEPGSVDTYSSWSRWRWSRLFGGMVSVRFDRSGRVDGWSGL
jgi:outer membrane protein assembly factor BamE (lipoprotein component of BamABCDE complex)